MRNEKKIRMNGVLFTSTYLVQVTVGFWITKTALYSNLNGFLEGPYWSAFCEYLSWGVSAIFWALIFPDMIHGMRLRKLARVDGSHDRV